jgi:hypothetical protein
MTTVTDLVLAEELFGRPRRWTGGGFGLIDGSGFQNPVSGRARDSIHPNARGIALANALDQYPAGTYGSTPAMETSSAGADSLTSSPSSPGRDATYGGEVSPMITGLQADGNTLEQRRGYAFPIPSRSPRPFSEDYPPSAWDHERRVATDAESRLLRDMEGRRLRAEYVVGRRHRDGPDVSLQPHEVIDVTTKLLGRSPRFLSEDQLRKRWPRAANPPVGETVPNFSDGRVQSILMPASIRASAI